MCFHEWAFAKPFADDAAQAGARGIGEGIVLASQFRGQIREQVDEFRLDIEPKPAIGFIEQAGCGDFGGAYAFASTIRHETADDDAVEEHAPARRGARRL